MDENTEEFASPDRLGEDALSRDEVSQFIEALTRSQGRLFAFILTLLPDHVAASDVLQNTNMVLWQKAGKFKAGSNFTAWSSTVAYYEVRAFRKRAAQDRHMFSDAFLEQVADVARDATSNSEQMAAKLAFCLKKLSSSQREMIQKRYAPGGCVAAMACELGKSEGTISQTLYRIRKQLARCLRASEATN